MKQGSGKCFTIPIESGTQGDASISWDGSLADTFLLHRPCGSPFARACSAATILAHPSIMLLTRSTSDVPRRSLLEISKIPPTDAESTPAPPENDANAPSH